MHEHVYKYYTRVVQQHVCIQNALYNLSWIDQKMRRLYTEWSTEGVGDIGTTSVVGSLLHDNHGIALYKWTTLGAFQNIVFPNILDYTRIR